MHTGDRRVRIATRGARRRAGAPVARRVPGDADEFPAQLRAIPEPPAFLYVRGALVADDALAVALVGSRHATPYGIAVAEELARELARRGVTIVSGLARGIDSAAHRGALEVRGRTIAVLGSGADVIYPPENRRLAREIMGSGAVVSQFAPGTPPFAHHFPARNRVIAGLALGVVVVEAAEQSGSLITARFAGELGREVMAVPGHVRSLASRGAHRLIQDGAALVQGWEDVVGQLPERWRRCLKAVVEPEHGPGSDGAPAESRGEAAKVLALLSEEPVSIEHVIERSGETSGRVAAVLLSLELEGRIRQLPGKRFVRTLP